MNMRDAKTEPAEVKICGRNACLAVFHQRPKDIRRVYLTKDNGLLFKPLMQWCAKQRLAYHIVEDEDIHKLTASFHHEGICLFVRAKPQTSLTTLVKSMQSDSRCLVYLDYVENPHNLGAILRVCAHFGVDGVLIAGLQKSLSAATMRTAQGGTEWLDVVPVSTQTDVLQTVRAAGFQLVATSSHASQSLYDAPLPSRTLLMFGAEHGGLRPSLLQQADEVRSIPGTGHLESLNVSCASAIFLAEYWRCYRQRQTQMEDDSAAI